MTTAFPPQNPHQLGVAMLILFPRFSSSTHHNSHKGQEIKRDRGNGIKIHVKSLLCKALTGDDDELMKPLTNRCTASQQQTEGPRQTKTEVRKEDGES